MRPWVASQGDPDIVLVATKPEALRVQGFPLRPEAGAMGDSRLGLEREWFRAVPAPEECWPAGRAGLQGLVRTVSPEPSPEHGHSPHAEGTADTREGAGGAWLRPCAPSQ